MKQYQCRKCHFAMSARKRPGYCPRCNYVEEENDPRSSKRSERVGSNVEQYWNEDTDNPREGSSVQFLDS